MPPLLRNILSNTIRQVSHGCTNNIDSYHHTSGSKMSPISSQEGAVFLVNMRFCPYAQRTVLCLNAKNVDYEVINSQLMKRVMCTCFKKLMIWFILFIAWMVKWIKSSWKSSNSFSQWTHHLWIFDHLWIYWGSE